jgi:hypothetical protein
VINKNIDLEEYFKDFKFKKNSFGGYKIDFHGINLDIWFLEDTWVIKKFPDIFTKTPLVYNLPDTPFFNFQSVIYLFDENKFIYNNAFVEFLENRIVDIVFEKNYLSDLCIINSFYYTDTINIQMSDKLAKYLLANYDYYTDYDKIQLKHFGYIPYTKEILNHKILKLTHVKQ